jgi:hypothetical protein
VAVEVHDEAVNDLLAAEVEILQTIRTETLSQNLFLRRRLTPKFLSSLHFGSIYFLADDDVAVAHN